MVVGTDCVPVPDGTCQHVTVLGTAVGCVPNGGRRSAGRKYRRKSGPGPVPCVCVQARHLPEQPRGGAGPEGPGMEVSQRGRGATQGLHSGAPCGPQNPRVPDPPPLLPLRL